VCVLGVDFATHFNPAEVTGFVLDEATDFVRAHHCCRRNHLRRQTKTHRRSHRRLQQQSNVNKDTRWERLLARVCVVRKQGSIKQKREEGSAATHIKEHGEGT
jgi:hypothetical protein